MTPMDRTVRAQLKRVHPGLTDADIDRYEELTSLRSELDPARAAERIRQIDAERERLVREKMPRLADLESAFFARTREQNRPIEKPPIVEIKAPDTPRKS